MISKFAEHRRVATFAFVGVVNTAIDFSLFWILTQLLHLNPLISNVIGYTIGALNSYFGNARFTFMGMNDRYFSWRSFWRFAAVTILCLLLSTAALSVFLNPCGPLGAKAISIFVTFAGGYLLNRLYVFKSI